MAIVKCKKCGFKGNADHLSNYTCPQCNNIISKTTLSSFNTFNQSFDIFNSKRFTNLKLIAEGLTAKVYKAIDCKTDSHVAIKILNPNLDTDEISIERFKREIQITRHIGHPKIVSIFELLYHQRQISLVMEYINGLSLKDYLRLNHPIKIELVISILSQLIDILSACHSKNVIHRDLKPQNVMVEKDGNIRLLDFGISRMTGLSDLTKTGTSLGTPEYMAPELFSTNTYDPRTDIYSLGIICYELITSKLPFQGDSIAILFNQHLCAPIQEMDELRPGVPGWLQNIIKKMLNKEPADRYQSIEELSLDIENKKVISKSFPQLAKIECINCGQLTITELPVCTHCGFNFFDICLSGKYQLICEDQNALSNIPNFFKKILNCVVPKPKKGTKLIISGIDRFSADILKASAMKHKIYLIIKKSSLLSLIFDIGLYILFIYSSTAVIFGLYPIFTKPLPFAKVIHNPLFLSFFIWNYLIIILFGALLAALSFWGILRRRRPPLIRDPKKIITKLYREHNWIKKISYELKKKRSKEMDTMVSHFIEKYLLLKNFTNLLRQDIKEKLEGLLQALISLANLIDEIKFSLSTINIADLSYRYQSTQESDKILILKKEINNYYQLEEKYVRVINKFIYIQFLFNQLIGNALVLNLSSLDLEVKEILSCAEELKKDFQITLEIRNEIGIIT
ncbi:MAG: serine/threonine-protein kinase [bacterium]